MGKSPTVLLCYAQGLPGCVPWGVLNSYFSDYLAQARVPPIGRFPPHFLQVGAKGE